MPENKSLTVYKASAGSGKTFKLALEFIKLLMVNPRRYENILAVTFTNKATDEMKHRIVSQLYGLSNRLESSNGYMEKITEELGMTPETVQQRAAIALHNLLHNYSMFRVQTIDTFFQSVLRNMAKELGLGNNLRISINDKEVISHSVDSLLEGLNNNPELMMWMREYIYEHMDEQNNWNVISNLKEFGNNLSKEFYKRNEYLLARIADDKQFFTKYKKELNKIIKEREQKYIAKGDIFFNLLSQNGFSIDDLFSKKTGPAGYFIKLKKGNFGQVKDDLMGTRVKAAYDDPEKWHSKKSPEALKELARTKLTPLLVDTEKDRKHDIFLYNSARITLKNINNMRMLFNIRQEMEELNANDSQFMLSNTQTLLSEMINSGNNEAPFIFEKIGAYLKHIMIDEFQDTSTVQWKNFKVLLEECMSCAGEELTQGGRLINNLIVGDVKQSIYRFRNGDWRLLNDIDQDFYDDQLNTETLDTNWRSERNIIDFNNAFFKNACLIEANNVMPTEPEDIDILVEKENLSAEIQSRRAEYAKSLRHAYSDVKQNVPEHKPSRGFVRMEFLPIDKIDDFRAEALKRTIEYTRSLVAQGAKLSDVAILVRGNLEATLIANEFAIQAPELPIISDEAFSLEASPLVLMLISAIKYVNNRDMIDSRNTLLKLYSEYIADAPESTQNVLAEEDAFERILPKELTMPEELNRLKILSLNELVERLFSILQLSKLTNQHSYASTFFDNVKSFINDKNALPNEFIKYWDEDLHSKSISIGSKNCIRVLTIHKSKGLEYPHVIMPFSTWKLTPVKTETLWCQIDEAPFNALPFIPVDFKTKESLNNSIYERYGVDEWMQELVDHLNILYVGFTRAERSLLVIANQDCSSDHRTRLLLDTAIALAENAELDNLTVDGLDEIRKTIEDSGKTAEQRRKEKQQEEEEKVPFTLQYGKLYIGADTNDTDADTENNGSTNNAEEKKAADAEQNIFETKPASITYTTRSFDNPSVLFRQSNKSREFADNMLDDEDKHRLTTKGSILHQLFSRIKTLNDVEKTLRQFEFDGVIYNDDITAEELRAELSDKFRNPMVQEWFSDKWTVFNECNIMHIENGRIVEDRPDRVITDGQHTIVIDYKFGKRNKAYAKQVQRYMERMREMSYPDIKGYIWYVNEPDGIVEV